MLLFFSSMLLNNHLNSIYHNIIHRKFILRILATHINQSTTSLISQCRLKCLLIQITSINNKLNLIPM